MSPARVLTVEEVRTWRDRRAFIELPYHLYRRDRSWVPPLRSEVRHRLSRRHPFFEHAQRRLFLARRGTEVCGRIAALVNEAHNAFHRERCGFFGFFECDEDPAAATALLEAAEEWCAARGMETFRGPVSASTNDECGLLVEGFDSPPAVMMPYNPPWYAGRLEAWGLRPVKDLHAYELRRDEVSVERLLRIRERLANRPGLRVRPVALERFGDEAQVVLELYNKAWERNWGFVPLTPAEIRDLARHLRPLIRPELALFAELEGRPVGFSLTLPDVNEVLIRLPGRLSPLGALKLWRGLRRIRGLRVITLGVLPGFRRRGLEALLYLTTIENGLRLGYEWAELSWVLDSNVLMIRAIAALGARLTKRYRIYEKEIVPRQPCLAPGAAGIQAPSAPS